MKLSIVATLYQSAQSIEEFCRRAKEAARQIVEDSYEIVLVNDGSPDSSLEMAVRLCESDPHIVVVDLSRNFGHHKAMMTGLAHARGTHVFLIDSDLEEEPEWLLSFAKQMEREHCDVVYGVQGRRKGGLFERWSGHCFYFLFRVLTGLAIPKNVVVARLMTRRYVNALLRHDEREVFLAGLWVITGFDQSPQTITKHSTDVTAYTFRRKILQLVDSITSFSNVPLIGIFFIGCAISTLSGAFTLYLIVNWLLFANPPSGWTSVMTTICLFCGLIVVCVGTVGIYLAKVFSETKRRPYTIVRRLYGAERDKVDV